MTFLSAPLMATRPGPGMMHLRRLPAVTYAVTCAVTYAVTSGCARGVPPVA